MKTVVIDIIGDAWMAGQAPGNFAAEGDDLRAAEELFVEALRPKYMEAAEAIGVSVLVSDGFEDFERSLKEEWGGDWDAYNDAWQSIHDHVQDDLVYVAEASLMASRPVD